LTERVYNCRYNALVFSGRLPASMPLAWSAKLQRTAGTCSFRTVGGTQRTAAIELSEKVLVRVRVGARARNLG
jgi:hypothetical protein